MSTSRAPGRGIAIAYDASGDGSGVYPFTLTVRNDYGTSTWETVISDTLLLVDRSQSEFGRGWWLAGVEQLVTNQPNNSILWLGGDGSAKLFRNVGTYTWVAPAGAFRDTLTLAGGIYTRTLRHGIQVKFNSAGQHIATVNRVGQTSTFTWSSSPSRLTGIEVPPGGTGTAYNLAYDGNQKLDFITDPPNRTLQVTVNGGRMTSITDPDGYGPSFTYDGAGRMTGRTTRRGYTADFLYAKGLRVTEVRLPWTEYDKAATHFQPWDEKGLATGPSGTWAADTGSYTKILGPRPAADDASFWVDRWGAPVKILDPMGETTRVVRGGNAAVPALVTEVIYPNDRRVKMAWDARGNLTEMRDSTLHVDGRPTAVSAWTYDHPNTDDSPDRVIDPENVTTRFGYNSWGLTDSIVSPNSHVTEFQYIQSGAKKGLVSGVIEHDVAVFDSAQNTEVMGQTPTWTFEYNSLGNLWKEISPLQNVRRFERDAMQRVQYFYDPLGHKTEFEYDALNRRTRQIQHVEGGQTLVTRFHYAIDVVDSIIDPRGVLRRFAYNARGDQIQEWDDYGRLEDRFFDEAGLLEWVRPRVYSGTSSRIWHTYDQAGRKVKTKWPPRDVAEDSVIYTYDSMGRMDTATTSGRKVARSYYANGLLRQEVQSASNGSNPLTHKYNYDGAGRRISYRIGSDAENDSIWYRYDGTTGELNVVGVRWRSGARDSVRFQWDELGRRDTLKYTNGMVVGFAYDLDGRFRRLCSTHGRWAPDNVFQARVAHEWVDADGLVRRLDTFGDAGCNSNTTLEDFQDNTYDIRHQLVEQVMRTGTTDYAYDGSGNMTMRQRSPGETRYYEMPAGHNRLFKDVSGADPDDFVEFIYDQNGARAEEYPFVDGSEDPINTRRRWYLYDGLGRTVRTGEYVYVGGALQPVESPCAYDPLGRMWDPCENGAPALGFDGENVVRTGYDGQDYTWTFVHGPGLDDPLLGYKHLGPSNPVYLYWLTDGQGRQYGVGDADGYDYSQDNHYTGGGKFAGGITSANSFDAERYPNPAQKKLSFFRNRFFDQETGRWTQEDPIGVAGGINLYAYAGNDPVSYTDPFGLQCKDLEGNEIRCPAPEAALESAGLLDPVLWVTGGIGGGGLRLLGARLFSAPAKEAAQVTINQAVGRAAERVVRQELKAAGIPIIGSQVTVRTSLGNRVVDHLIRLSDDAVMAVEVKANGGARTALQLAKDRAMAVEGGTIIGKNAPELIGQTVRMMTVVARVVF